MARRAVRLRGSRASCFPHSDTEMFAVVFKLSAYKLSERLRPATVADVSAGFMTHFTCRLTAKHRDQLGTLRSLIEYGQPLSFFLPHW